MGRKNYLIEGLSGTGKTAVCDELQRRGHHAVHGDRELAYQGDPGTGAPTDTATHENHVWRVDTVRALAAERGAPATFFCGGSRNSAQFAELFDAVFVLQVDVDTLTRRLDVRPDAEWAGGEPVARERILRWHATGDGVPEGIPIDATAPITDVVDAILRHVVDGGGRLSR